MVVKADVLAKHPWLARALFNAFIAAKNAWLARLIKGDGASADDARYRALSALVGDPLPYGLAANRPSIEALITYALQQQLIPSRPPMSEIFLDPQAA